MRKHTFTLWLYGEVASVRCALLTLYEQRDKLQYIEGPRLEKEYMDAIGTYEETVIKEEIECELLKKKQQMIQTALNRRESIDETAIDAALDIERQRILNEAMGTAAPTEYAEISAEYGDELQKLYRDIVKNFHPQMHPELTEVHHQLFQKAQEAYRLKDLEALKLIHEMLHSTMDSGLPIELFLEFLTGVEDDGEEVEENSKRDYATDYSVASQLYGSFKPTSEEAVIQEEWVRYRQLTENVMNEIERLRLTFPYTAVELLSSPEKIQTYRDDLTHRLRTATAERERRIKEIQEMMKGVTAHE